MIFVGASLDSACLQSGLPKTFPFGFPTKRGSVFLKLGLLDLGDLADLEVLGAPKWLASVSLPTGGGGRRGGVRGGERGVRGR